MEWDTYVALIDGLGEFPAAQTVAFAGFGEPLMHPRFVDMVRLAHERGLRTEMTTNALLIDREKAIQLLEAGLDQLVVSIDGASAEAFTDVRTGASLSKVIENVQLFWQVGQPGTYPPLTVGIEFVAMKRNVHELPGLQWVAKMLRASFVLVTNVLPYSAEMEDEVLYDLRTTAFEDAGSPGAPKWILPRMDFSTHTQEPLSKLLRSHTNLGYLDIDLNARNNFCPFVGKDGMAVDWQGNISPCPPLMHTYRCVVMGRQKEFRHYHIANVNARSVRSTWEQPAYAAFRQRVRDFDFAPCVDCGGCYMAETNEEDCFGNPFPVCGDCLWARGVVRCA